MNGEPHAGEERTTRYLFLWCDRLDTMHVTSTRNWVLEILAVLRGTKQFVYETVNSVIGF
jgi:hypothetical protein